MNITKKEALEICKELWIWMRDEKHVFSIQKDKWPRWKTYGKMFSDCPCCQYTRQLAIGCNGCPLLFLWGKRKKSVYSFPCLWPKSPYLPFEEGKGSPELAQKIIDACDKELKKSTTPL